MKSQKFKYTITIAILNFNRVKFLDRAIRSCVTQYLSDKTKEVIVIDDFSQDNTNKLLRENETLFNHMISLEKNQGKGGAILRGVEKAKGEYILFCNDKLYFIIKDRTKDA